jgi:hypothetical protein
MVQSGPGLLPVPGLDFQTLDTEQSAERGDEHGVILTTLRIHFRFYDWLN